MASFFRGCLPKPPACLPGEPAFGVLMHLDQGIGIHIDHMAGGVIGEGQVVLKLIIDEHVVIHPLRSIERGRGIIVAAQHPDLQEGIFGHGFIDRVQDTLPFVTLHTILESEPQISGSICERKTGNSSKMTSTMIFQFVPS